MQSPFSFCACVIFLVCSNSAADEALRKEAAQALHKAVQFFDNEVAENGGYVWKYSADLRHRQGEGLAYDQRIWVQPPGTPAVGMALLSAYEATRNPAHLQAAQAAAKALVKGQLYSGGWPYSITFDAEQRKTIHYRTPPSKGEPAVQPKPGDPGGWAVWKQRRYKTNMTLLDDDTTQSALRFLMRIDKALEFNDAAIHEAVQYGLASLLKAQYPIGAWSHNYDRFPRQSPDAAYYPIQKAAFPDDWPRVWPKKYAGCYTLNDRITLTAIETMLDAHAIYEEQTYLQSALRGGEFLLLAQMPDPQPAWAQQYDRRMRPVWDRKFEPPAITGLESQAALETLLLLYRQTGQEKYLKPVPKALAYLRRSELADGKLARFYELQTNRPIFFTEDYEWTYERDAMPSHYAFVVNSRLEAIALRYRLLARDGVQAKGPQISLAELREDVRHIIRTMDERGAWTEPGWVRDRHGEKVEPQGGIIRSETFIDNVERLSAYLSYLQ